MRIIDDKILEYYKEGYRRIYDNFLFSFQIYAYDRLMLKRLCKSSLEQLESLNQKSLQLDKVSTFRLMTRYKKVIETEYRKL